MEGGHGFLREISFASSFIISIDYWNEVVRNLKVTLSDITDQALDGSGR